MSQGQARVNCADLFEDAGRDQSLADASR